MTNFVDLSEECKIWPIGIRLFSSRLFLTLWGEALGDDDLILADERGFLLFSTLPRLSAFVFHPCKTNMSSRPGFLRLKRQLGARPWGRSDVFIHRMDEVYKTLLEFDALHLTRGTRSQIVNCLNLLWDVACNRNDQDAKALLQGRSPLARLLDVLTFHDPEVSKPPARLHSLKTERLAADYASLVGRFVLSSTLIR
jgi:hypothetical protein